jgi:phenylalanyl-tRNA synthetase beta chain
MQFPESWLREFCNPPLTTAELADLLTMAGMEVEELRPVAPPFSGVVVAEIVEADQHPNADRLRVCKVDAGVHSKDGPLQIVCGAPNARVGLRVPLALVGAALPPGENGQPFQIKASRLRGVESMGMLCSARELKLSEDHGGLLELPADATLGRPLRDLLQLDDTLFTLKLTPNLAHCLSVYGVAREVSALTGAPLCTPSIDPVAPVIDVKLPVHIEAPDLCGRFSGRVVRGVDPRAPTPPWMVQRLARCGQRSVNALVDISNYVMFEFGRPSHIFDLDKIHESLVVRWARPGETLALLNGQTVALDAQVGVIADLRGPESLAGIMGGQATSVTDDTRSIYIEAAFWSPQAVAGRSRQFNFSTEAGHRFERGVDPALTVAHTEHLTRLVIDICGGQPGPIDDQTTVLPTRSPVTLRVARAAKVIGMPVTQAQCAQVFRGLGLQFTETPGALQVTPPSWRFDLQIEEDLIEEVIRIIGYSKLPESLPSAALSAPVRPEATRSPHAVRHAMASLGYLETINFSFVEARWEHELAGQADPIKVLNPIAAPLSVMRSSLIGSLVQVLRNNLARKATRVRVFELGRVFHRARGAEASLSAVKGIGQPMKLAALAYGPLDEMQWGEPERWVDFFDMKGDLQALLAPAVASFAPCSHPALHPGRCASVSLGGAVVGVVGELHPQWRQAYELPAAPMLMEIDLAAVLARPVPSFTPLPKQQPAWRDLALVLPDTVSHDALVTVLADDPAGLVRFALLFDIYKPPAPTQDVGVGQRSMAVRLELLDDHVTLTDERIDAATAAAVQRAMLAFGARLRG